MNERNGYINTETKTNKLRKKILRPETKQLLVTRLANSSQEHDIKLPVNCEGLGRIRTFKKQSSSNSWPANPLPIEPAAKKLGLSPSLVHWRTDLRTRKALIG